MYTRVALVSRPVGDSLEPPMTMLGTSLAIRRSASSPAPSFSELPVLPPTLSATFWKRW
jgi:hypothetical protein